MHVDSSRAQIPLRSVSETRPARPAAEPCRLRPLVPDVMVAKLQRLDARLADIPAYANALAWSRKRLGLLEPTDKKGMATKLSFGRSRSASMPTNMARPAPLSHAASAPATSKADDAKI